MYIKEISLTNYRNIESAEIFLSEGLNIFYGDNAQGKTNALESMFLISAGKSFKKAKDNDLINFYKENAEVYSVFNDGKNLCNIKVKLSKNEKKKVFLDDMLCDRVSDYIGRINTVLFTPDHLSLVKSEPENRRKFLDLAICQARPAILSVYKEYSKLLSQKSALIKEARENSGYYDKNLVEIYNEKMAQCCKIIAEARINICNKLSLYGEAIYKEMTGGKEIIDFEYVKSVKNDEDLKQSYFDLLEEGFKDELRMGFCCYGIQRDDLKIKINGKNAREFASQGQQRSAVLAMKLSEGDFLMDCKNSMPIFLFDDILSELDNKRREYIMEKLNQRQVVLTSCNQEFLEKINANKYYVKNGTYKQI